MSVGHGSRWRRWVLLASAALFVAVGALMAWPEPDAKLLVSADGWEVEGGFVSMQPAAGDVRRSVFRNPQARYWRSWAPGKGSQPGVLRSKPFFADGTIAVPYNGFAGEPGIETFLDCVQNGARMPLATGLNNIQWSEVLLSPSADFCSGPVRIVATTDSTQFYVAIGSPSQISALSVFKQSTVPALWFLALAWAVISGWFRAIAKCVSERWGLEPLFAGLIGIGLIGYLQFFAYWFQPRIGDLFSVAIVLSGLFWTGRHLRNWAKPVTLSGPASSAMPVAVGMWLLAAALLLAVALIADSGAGAWAINGRFTPARWSSDNQLPGIISRALVSGGREVGDMGQWTIADRPPLAYGWHATLHGVLRSLAKTGDGRSLFDTYQLATGIVLNTAWMPVFCLLLPKLGLSRFKTLLIASVAALCPFFIFNSLFIWPKLLSGSFALAAAWILLGMDRTAPRLRQDDRGLLIAAALSAMALLTHGGSAFGIIAAIVLAAAFRGLPTWKGSALAAATAIALLLPWSLWQTYVQPPGNALVKYAFAGTFGFGEEKMGVFETIVRSYRGLSLDAWLTKKAEGLSGMLFGLKNSCGMHEMGVRYWFVDGWRVSDFMNAIPSLNLLVLGFAVIFVRAFKRGRDTADRGAARLVAFAVFSLALSLLATWDCHINHHQSYQALMALHLGLLVALANSGRLGVLAFAATAIYGLFVWILEPLSHFPRHDYIAAAVFAALVVIWVRMLMQARAVPQETSL